MNASNLLIMRSLALQDIHELYMALKKGKIASGYAQENFEIACQAHAAACRELELMQDVGQWDRHSDGFDDACDGLELAAQLHPQMAKRINLVISQLRVMQREGGSNG